MQYLPLYTTRRVNVIATPMAAILAIGGGIWLILISGSFAQDSAGKDKAGHPKNAKQVEKPEAVAPLAPTVQVVPTAPTQPTTAVTPDFAARLKENGAGTCAAQVDAMAAEAMGNVRQFNTASSWAKASGDKRIVTLSIGQRYADSSPVPYGATSVLAAPNGQGSCDAVAVQVVPSPLSCTKLREAMSANGQQIGDLAGVLLMQDAAGQTMLVPTAANTCVLVGLRTAYTK